MVWARVIYPGMLSKVYPQIGKLRLFYNHILYSLRYGKNNNLQIILIQ